MVLGRIGKNLAAEIGAAGGRAVGLSGRDDGMMRMRQTLDVDATLLRALVGMGIVPVVAPLAIGDGTETVKLDADTVAGAVTPASCAFDSRRSRRRRAGAIHAVTVPVPRRWPAR